MLRYMDLKTAIVGAKNGTLKKIRVITYELRYLESMHFVLDEHFK